MWSSLRAACPKVAELPSPMTGMRSPDDWIKKRVAKEVAESRQRYVVSDLLRMTRDHARAYAPGEGDDPLKLPGTPMDVGEDELAW